MNYSDIQDSDVYIVSEIIKKYGIKKDKIYRAIKRGKRCGGLDAIRRVDNCYLQVSGKELRRYLEGRPR
nr:hypothetical protein [Bacteroides acidifaciens]